MTNDPTPPNKEMTALSQALLHFSEERQWQTFHIPKNLAMALSVEAAEIVELFQWLTPEQSQTSP